MFHHLIVSTQATQHCAQSVMICLEASVTGRELGAPAVFQETGVEKADSTHCVLGCWCSQGGWYCEAPELPVSETQAFYWGVRSLGQDP